MATTRSSKAARRASDVAVADRAPQRSGERLALVILGYVLSATYGAAAGVVFGLLAVYVV